MLNNDIKTFMKNMINSDLNEKEIIDELLKYILSNNLSDDETTNCLFLGYFVRSNSLGIKNENKELQCAE